MPCVRAYSQCIDRLDAQALGCSLRPAAGGHTLARHPRPQMSRIDAQLTETLQAQLDESEARLDAVRAHMVGRAAAAIQLGMRLHLRTREAAGTIERLAAEREAVSREAREACETAARDVAEERSAAARERYEAQGEPDDAGSALL